MGVHTSITDVILGTWLFCGVVLFVYNWLNVPVQFVFFCNRVTQFRDARFDLRPTTPTHALIHYYCAILYGILVPAFFFATSRLGREVGVYYLGSELCNGWVTFAGVLCMAWLIVHVIHGISSGDRLRFGGWIDRVFAGAGLAYCLWFHACTLGGFQLMIARFKNGPHDEIGYLFFFIYEQGLIFGATLVYGFALMEARRTAKTIFSGLHARQWAWRAGVFAFVLAPWWLSLPHTSHGRAINLIEQNRGAIKSLSKEAEFDPRLLAGIIYVGQTQQHSRLTGDLIDRLGLEIDEKGIDIIGKFTPILPFNDPVGLCQIRPKDWLNVMRRANSADTRRLKWTPTIFTGGDEWDPTFGVKAMLDPGDNLESGAMMLYLLRDQWRSAGFKAADDPEILATIFSGGIENSRPEKSPKPNEFGRRVKAFMESDDCRRALEGN